MKLKYLLYTVLSAVIAFGSCTKDENLGSLKSIQVSKSYVSISPDGSTETVNIVATQDWTISEPAEWLTLSTLSGSAGETKLNLSAEKCDFGREAVLQIKVGPHTQFITVRQGNMTVETVTCKEAMEGVIGKTYRIRGAVTRITGAVYGNMYIDDGSGVEAYIYGTLDKNGAEKNFASLGIEVGDIVTVEGPLASYGGVAELLNVTVSKIEKSIMKLDKAAVEVDKEGGEFELRAAYKGNGVFVEMPEDSPISFKGIDYVAGIPTKLVTSPADTAVLRFSVPANEDDVRIMKFNVSSKVGTSATTLEVTVTQASGLACYSLPYEETFANGQGAWTIVDNKGIEGGFVWFYDSSQKVMKASGYVSKTKTNYETDSDLVSPRIDLTGVTAASMAFEHAAKYGASLDDELTLWVSKDNGVSFTQVLIPVYTDKKSWDFVSNTVSLTPFVGNQILVKFKYKSYTTGGSTSEIRNVSIKAEEVAVSNIAQLNSTAATTTAEYDITLTDAVVSYVNGDNVFIQDATAGIQLYKKTHGLAAGQKINGAVKIKLSLYNGFAEATDIDLTNATVTTETAPDPVVKTIADLNKAYLRNQNCLVKVENVTFAASADGTKKVSDTITQGEDTMATRTQVKTISYSSAPQAYDLVCIPSRYNADLQLGIWEAPVAR